MEKSRRIFEKRATKRFGPMNTKDKILDYIDTLQSIVDFQTNNGILDELEAEKFFDDLKKAKDELKTSETESEKLSHMVFSRIVGTMNKKKLGIRLRYIYGIHIWIFLSVFSLGLITLILKNMINYPLVEGVSADVIVWGGLGGCAYAFYHLRKNVYTLQLSKYYSVYWIVYPVAGMIFGLGVVFVVNAGFIQLDAKATYSIYATISFIAGMLQEWSIATIKDIAYSIHAPKGP